MTGRVDSHAYWRDRSRGLADGPQYRGHYHRRVAEQEEEFVVTQLMPRQRRVLEIGPGTGRFTRHLLRLSDEVVVCDLNQSALDDLQTRMDSSKLTTVCCPVEELGDHLDSFSFDAAVAMRVLPYVEDLAGVLLTLSRSVCQGGILLFDLWNDRSFEGWWLRTSHRSVPLVPHFLTAHEMSQHLAGASIELLEAFRWGYPRIGTLTCDFPGGLLFPNWAYSTTFCGLRP